MKTLLAVVMIGMMLGCAKNEQPVATHSISGEFSITGSEGPSLNFDTPHGWVKYDLTTKQFSPKDVPISEVMDAMATYMQKYKYSAPPDCQTSVPTSREPSALRRIALEWPAAVGEERK